MKYGARALVVGLVAFTALAMAFYPSFSDIVVVSIGPLPLYIFDVLLLASVAAFFYVVSLRVHTDPSSANRLALRLTGAYLLYQLLIVMPVAIVVYDIGPGDTYTALEARFALVLFPFFYYVGLRYLRPRQLVLIVNVAAVALLAYALYRYVFIGPEGIYEYGEFRLRILWGGSTLLFGWLAVTAPLLQKRALYAYGLCLGGILGVVLVNHRSGYVALIAAFVAYIVLSRRLTPRLVAVATVVVIGGVLLSMTSATIRQNATYSLTTMFNANSDASAQDRVSRSALAWDYVRAHPLGDYVWTRRYYLVDLGDNGFEPHNFVIQALDKQGWVSSLLLFSVIASVLAVGWRLRRRSKLATAMTVYLVFYLVYCLFNTNFDATLNVVLFTIAAALVLDQNRTSHEADGRPMPAHASAPPAPPTRADRGAAIR